MIGNTSTTRKHALGACFSAGLSLLAMGPAVPVRAEVDPYPAIAGLITSDVFRVEVDGKSVWVEANRGNHVAHFACSPGVNLKVTHLKGGTGLTAHPHHRASRVVAQGSEFTGRLLEPKTLIVRAGEEELYLLADPVKNPEALAKTAATADRTFGPGTHKVGILNIGSGSVIIQKGAIVIGALHGSGSAKITGEGILDGSSLPSGGKAAIQLEGGSGGLVEGITIRNAPWFSFMPSGVKGLTVRNVKIFSDDKDGIDPVQCQNMKILDCTIKTADDAIAIKQIENTPTDNILVQGCTLAGTKFGDGFTIGFEIKNSEVRNVIVKDCDILKGVGGNGVGGHSGFSIICDGKGTVRDILFEDIRVESDVTKNFEIQITSGSIYPRLGTGIGHVKNVTLRNVTWKADKGIILKGRDATHLVENVTFENCKVAGKTLRSTQDAKFTVNSFVKNVKFTASGSTPTALAAQPANTPQRPQLLGAERWSWYRMDGRLRRIR